MTRPTIQPAPLVFFIDLDETLLVTANRLKLVHSKQSLTSLNSMPRMLAMNGEVSDFIPAFILNREYLSEVFTLATTLCSHIVVLTSGGYEPQSIIDLLQNELDVSPDVSEKLGQVRVHSLATDFKYFLENRTREEAVRYTLGMNKAERIKMLRKQFPELHHNSILFDDSEFHIDKCNQLPDVKAVQARTMTADNKSYYQQLVDTLILSHHELQPYAPGLATAKPIPFEVNNSLMHNENYCYTAVTRAEEKPMNNTFGATSTIPHPCKTKFNYAQTENDQTLALEGQSKRTNVDRSSLENLPEDSVDRSIKKRKPNDSKTLKTSITKQEKNSSSLVRHFIFRPQKSNQENVDTGAKCSI